MAQAVAPRVATSAPSALAGRRSATAGSSRTVPQPCVMRSGQWYGGQRFRQQQQQQQQRQHRGRARACTPRGFYGPGVGFTMGWAPNDLHDMMQEFEKWAGPTARAPRGSDTNPLTFPVDLLESSDAYTFFADLPGVARSDTKVQAKKEERELIISGDRSAPSAASEEEGEGRRRRRTERRFGAFKRSFMLPEDADLDSISARFKDGVLEVTVKRVQPAEPEVTTVPIDDWIDVQPNGDDQP